MIKSNTLRGVLLAGAAAVILVGCSDTDISSPGEVVFAGTPTPPAPTPPATPTTPDPIVTVPASYSATVAARNELTIVNVPQDDGGTAEMVRVQGPVVEDLTIIAGVPYYLESTVFIGQDAGSGATSGTGVTLTIDPGATIYGEGATAGIVINRGSSIDADGNASNPIILTSFDELQREEGVLPADDGASSEWLGLVINGFAPINNCNSATATPGTADCQDDGEAASGLYGGGDTADGMGTVLNYVRVEFAGVFYTEEDQSNGIAFQGVGTGADVSFVQVHNNGDDGVEFFGGTVNVSDVAITGAADDAIDWTDGWTGSMQRALVNQRAGDGDYAIEGDNRSRSAADREPRSNPIVTNFTFLGNGGENAIRLREGTSGTVVNGIISSWASALRVADPETLDNMQNVQTDGTQLLIQSHLVNTTNVTANTTLDDNGTPNDTSDDTAFDGSQILPFLMNVSVDDDNVAAGFSFVPGLTTGNAQRTNENGELIFVITNAGTALVSVGDEVTQSELATLTANDNALGVSADPVTIIATAGTEVFDTATLSRAELEANNYIGAFSPEETEAVNWAAGWTRPGSIFGDGSTTTPTGNCPTGSVNITSGGQLGGQQVCDVAGTIAEDTTLTAGVIYRLNGLVSVGQDGGSAAANAAGTAQAELTIEPGVTIFGNSPVDGLVVARGSTINAVGSSAEPIVFTSGQAVAGAANYVDDSAQWLGLSLNGKAPLNRCNDATAPGTTGCERNGEGGSGLYGGGEADDTSGTLQYVRVEFAGIFLNEEDQSNGIQFNGTGSGTDVSFVQVHNNGDDGIEFFGGTTDIKYAVVTGARDDSIDWTDGWQGNAQYVIIEHSSSDYAFEGDNRSESAPDQAPVSTPQIANYTVLGDTNDAPGARFREGMAGDFVNGIIVNTSTGYDIDDDLGVAGGSLTNYNNDTLNINSQFIDATTTFVADSDMAEVALAANQAADNVVAGTNTMSGFSFFGRTAGVIPGANETAVTTFDPSDLNGTGETFFDAANFLGGVPPTGDNTTWYLGWTVDSTGAVTSAN